MQCILRSASDINLNNSLNTHNVPKNGGYTAINNDDVTSRNIESRGSYDSISQEPDLEQDSKNIPDPQNIPLDLPKTRLRSTSHIESISKRKLPLPEYISVVANATNALLGVSIFAMPWGFAKSGLLGGSLITVFVASLSFETARVLLEAQRILYLRTGLVQSYPEIAASTLGPVWSNVVHTATAISCLGGCVGFLIFLGELCGQLFGQSPVTVTIIAVFPLILLSWIRSFQELTLFTVIGVIALIASICTILIDGYQNTTNQSIQETPLFFPLKSSLNFLGPATFCYTIHYCVLAIGAEGLICVKHENISYLPHTSHMIISPIVLKKYERVELIIDDGGEDDNNNGSNSNNGHARNNGNYELINQNIKDNHKNGSINSNINSNSNNNENSNEDSNETHEKQLINEKQTIFLEINENQNQININNQINNPRNNFTASERNERNEGNERIERNNSNENNDRETLQFDYNPKREILSVIPDISKPLRISFFLTCALNILLGGAGFSFYRDSTIIRGADGYPQPGCEGHVCQNVILNLPDGRIKEVVGIALCISITLGYVLILAPARENIETALLRFFKFSEEPSIKKMMFKNTLRTLLVVGTALVAVLAPFFGEVLGVVGGLTDALQSFVLPPLICLCMRYKGSLQLSKSRRFFYISVFLWGLGTIVYTIIRLFNKL